MNYLKVENTTIHVNGTYASGMPRIMVKLEDIGLIFNVPHRDRAGRDQSSSTYLKTVKVLEKAGITW